MLRDAMGPDDPLYHLLMMGTVRDVVPFFEDFRPSTLDTTLWTVAGDGGANFAFLAGLNGLIRGSTSGNDEYSSIVGSEQYTSDHRCTAIFRVYFNSAIDNCKFEVGFVDGAQADGAVDVKDTPTPNADDYAVVIRDTDDDSSVDLVVGNATSGDTKLASSPGVIANTQTVITSSSVASPTILLVDSSTGFVTGNTVRITSHAGSIPDINGDHTITDIPDGTHITLGTEVTTGGTGGTAFNRTAVQDFTTQTWYDIMIACNEDEEVAFWIDSTFQGILRSNFSSGAMTSGPGPANDLTTLGLWAYVQGRDGTARDFDIDYILAWQERNRLPHSV
jgi:hypothetical protein